MAGPPPPDIAGHDAFVRLEEDLAEALGQGMPPPGLPPPTAGAWTEAEAQAYGVKGMVSAVEADDVAAVQQIIEEQQFKPAEIRSTFLYAAHLGRRQVAQALARGQTPWVIDDALCNAAREGHADCVWDIIPPGFRISRTLVSMAARGNNVELFRRLFQGYLDGRGMRRPMIEDLRVCTNLALLANASDTLTCCLDMWSATIESRPPMRKLTYEACSSAWCEDVAETLLRRCPTEDLDAAFIDTLFVSTPSRRLLILLFSEYGPSLDAIAQRRARPSPC